MIQEYNKNNNYIFKVIDKEQIEKELSNNPYAKIILYLKDNCVIGYLYYSDIYERIEINQIEVLNSYRKQGIATLLLDYLIKENKDITLEVRIDNIPAINLYKKFNFKQTAIRKNYYKDKDGILMQRNKDSL